MNKRLRLTIIITLIFISLTSILWVHSDTLSFRMWDEERNATNAIEMFDNGELIVRHYNGSPETYNLKPPLLIWLQTASLHVFGLNEIAIRFPSILASIASMFIVFLLVYKESKKLSLAILASGILVTSKGFYGDHVGRYGDHDALLVMLGIMAFYWLYGFIKTLNVSNLYLFALSVVLAIFCKSIAVFLLLPGFLICLIVSKRLLTVLRSPHFYISLVSGAGLIASYYLYRDFLQPGYFNSVWNEELFPRYFNTSETLKFNEEGPFYYLKLLVSNHFRPWFVLLFLTPIIYFKRNKKVTDLVMHSLIVAISFYVFVSSGTKNFWYHAPVFPFLAIIASFVIDALLEKINWVKDDVIAILTSVLILVVPTYLSLQNVISLKDPSDNPIHGITQFLKNEENISYLDSNSYVVLDQFRGYTPHQFYVKKLEIEKGIKLERKWLFMIDEGDRLVIPFKETLDSIQSIYNINIVAETNGSHVVDIIDKQ